MAIQPNGSTSEALTSQFDSLCTALHIPRSQSASSKLAALRSIPSTELVSSISKLSMHTFRSCTDDSFIPSSFLASLHDGTFTTRLAQSGVRITLGEVRDEALLYKLVNPPADHDSLVAQLRNYYPQRVVDKLLTLTDLYAIPTTSSPSSDTPPSSTTTESHPEAYADVFAAIVADMQVHASIRGLTHILLHPPSASSPLPMSPTSLMRYRIAWRASCLDAWLSPAVGVCHAADTPIWWGSGYRAGFTAEDKEKAEAFLEPFGRFLYGQSEEDGKMGGEDKVRLLDGDGVTREGARDEHWERGLRVWNAVWEAQKE